VVCHIWRHDRSNGVNVPCIVGAVEPAGAIPGKARRLFRHYGAVVIFV